MTKNTLKNTIIDKAIKQDINSLSNLILENAGVYRSYSKEDLSNATLIFMEVLTARMFLEHSKKLTMPQIEKLSKEAGNSLRQTVKLFTGVDLSKIYEKSAN